MRRLLFAAGVLTVVAADARGQTPTTINVCEILSRAEVEAFIGEKLRFSPRSTSNDLMGVRSDTCAYRGENWTISANIERGRDAAEAKKYLATFRGVSGKEAGAKAVPGLGDDSWFTTTTESKSGMLTVVRNGDVFGVSTSGKGVGAGSLEKTEAVMRKLLAAYDKSGKK